MQQLKEHTDERLQDACVPCTANHDTPRPSRDHVPSKALLDRPYPENLSTVTTCEECNAGYSSHEEYLSAFLSAVISGSSAPDAKRFPGAARILRRGTRLRKRIAQARRVQGHLWEEPEMTWIPETRRIEGVIVKNARGHVLFELGEQVAESPSYVWVAPLCRMSEAHRAEFEFPSAPLTGWPELGSRAMYRLVNGECGPGGWLTVQHGVYRFAVDEGPTVRIILREYLAAEVSWAEQ